MKAHIGPEYCINGTVIEIPLMLILVYIDVSLRGGDGFTLNTALNVNCWWRVSLVSEYLVLFLWKYVWHSVLTDKMWCELYNRTGTGICEYWDTATISI